jgi:two-component system sensor histidine kinase PilS (NtrC family)
MPSIQNQQSLKLFKVYSVYRLLLSLILLVTFIYTRNTTDIGSLKPSLFIVTCSLYLAFCTITLLITIFRKTAFENNQLFFFFLVDIIATILLVDATGGIDSGLGILMVVVVAASSILLTGQIAVLLAAMASIAILVDTYLLSQQGHILFSSFMPAGLMGIILFISSLFIHTLSQRIRNTQQQAEQSAATVSDLQQLNQLIVQRMRTGIIVVDNRGQIKIANQAASELLGGGSLAAGDYQQSPLRLHPNLMEQFQRWQKKPQYQTPPFRTTETGPELQASFSSLKETPSSDCLIFLENNRQIAQRAQQMKLASLGRFTASIAHEIRNPLGAISHASQLLEESQSLGSTDQRMCEIIKKQSLRMNNIIENILNLSKRSAPKPERLELNQWLEQFIIDFKNTGEFDCDISVKGSTLNCDVTIDTGHLRQVLTNLIQNGLRYSQQATGAATLTFSIHSNSATGLPVLDIIDQGPGIAADNRARLFEPFFTTESKGTGLGLYISRELCEVNQARLDYTRTEKGESCFRLSFPHPEHRLLSNEETISPSSI